VVCALGCAGDQGSMPGRTMKFPSTLLIPVTFGGSPNPQLVVALR